MQACFNQVIEYAIRNLLYLCSKLTEIEFEAPSSLTMSDKLQTTYLDLLNEEFVKLVLYSFDNEVDVEFETINVWLAVLKEAPKMKDKLVSDPDFFKKIMGMQECALFRRDLEVIIHLCYGMFVNLNASPGSLERIKDFFASCGKILSKENVA